MDPLEQAKQTFLEESAELLGQFEDLLLSVDAAGDVPDDTVNALFRAAHTIKGSAGLFGFDAVVHFTHDVESVLDRLRNREIGITEPLVSLLLACGDRIADLIARTSNGGSADAAPDEQGLQAQLQALLKSRSETAIEVSAPAEPVVETREESSAADHWHLSLRFGRDVLRNGLDPLSFIRYLRTLGEIVHLTTLFDNLPGVDAFDPESCYLGFEIALRSNADKAAIDGAFDFVRDDSLVRVLPPHSRIGAYIELIRELPEDAMRLGEILVAAGTLTRRELDEALQLQEQARAQGDAGTVPPLGEILVEQGVVHEPVMAAALDKQKQTAEKASHEQRVIKVQADKLDLLINLVGELVIAGAGANLLAARSRVPELAEATSVISRLVEQIRDSALQLRMVQIGETFHRFKRVVRDVSRELGKSIDLEITGAETELDKTVVEKIGDPLMHLVRNAMDHGIESVEARRAAGKPETGRLQLNAYHDSGSIVIEVIDDGGGLDREKIRRKAIEKGLIESEQILSDRDIFNLIMEPGFSTADAVSNLSGRGVGMDVVKRNITALRGTVDLDSREGAGTTVRIRLPLTLAIIDGFLVGVGPSSCVIPLDMVVECLELSDAGQQGGRNYLNLRGEVLPFVRLRELFEVGGEAPKRENVVVVRYAGARAGLVVDELLGEFQTVIKPLGKLFTGLRGIGGSTILGSGEVALILDVPALIKLAAKAEAELVSAGKERSEPVAAA